MVESGQIRLAQPFWKSPDAYMRNSPAFHIEDIDAPLLLLHGDLDLGVTGLPGAERMYNLMLRAGKKPALVRYWGQGHVAQSAWALRDQWQRITTWFDHYVNRHPLRASSRPATSRLHPVGHAWPPLRRSHATGTKCGRPTPAAFFCAR
jgi:hypothetical protein